jgi:hypothetical protein
VPDPTDTDGDTVNDCDDVCPRGDDRFDCDSDGVPDDCEPDGNGNGIPDDCDQRGDANHDGRINLEDYAELFFCLGESGPNELPLVSFCFVFLMDGDFDIDLKDVSIMFNRWDGPPPIGD